MKKDMRTNSRAQERQEKFGDGLVSRERAKEIGDRYGAADYMECSSLKEPADLKQIVRKVYDLAVDRTSTDRRTMRDRVDGIQAPAGLLASVYQSCVLL